MPYKRLRHVLILFSVAGLLCLATLPASAEPPQPRQLDVIERLGEWMSTIWNALTDGDSDGESSSPTPPLATPAANGGDDQACGNADECGHDEATPVYVPNG